MSEYKIQYFNHELPKRLKSLLETYYPLEKTKGNGYEVTFLISIANCLFANTKEQIENKFSETTVSDQKVKLAEELLEKKVNRLKNDLFKNIQHWGYAEIKFKRNQLKSEFLKNEKFKKIIETNKEFGGIIRSLRNSLSHNGFCFGGDEGRINECYFFSKTFNGADINNEISYHVHKVPVHEFYTFTLNWIRYLTDNNLQIAHLNLLLDQHEQETRA